MKLVAEEQPLPLWAICLCAQWCGVCRDYRSVFEAAAAQYPALRFAWIDIEDEAELAGELDIETFPALLIADERAVRFAGPLTPQPATLLRLLASIGPAGGKPAPPEAVTLAMMQGLALRPDLWIIPRLSRLQPTAQPYNPRDTQMNPLPLTLALGQYDHTRDVTDGSLPVEGVALRTLNLPIEEIFYRFTLHREWDISEMSMGKYIAMRAQEDKSVMALPVFVSRAFRHSMFYVKTGSAIKRPEDLAGKRIGVPEWAQTAGIYGRGYLSDYVGIDLKTIEWVQAGVNEPGRKEKVKLHLPEGMRYSVSPDQSLNSLLLSGGVDAVMSARPPNGFGTGIERLMPDYQAAEEQYFKDTGIYPIMHGLVVKGSVIEEHPWVAMNLYKAFLKAKEQSIERLGDVTASHAPLAWLPEYVRRMRQVFGEDSFPYGIAPGPAGEVNRTTLGAFAKFGFEQGVCKRLLDVDELFPKNVLSSFKV